MKTRKATKKKSRTSATKRKMRSNVRALKVHTNPLVRDYMTNIVRVEDPNMSVKEGARRMREEDYGALMIGKPEELLGIVTDRDIVIRTVAEGKDLEQTKLKDIMTDGPFYCFEDQTVPEATRIMSENQIRRIPVMSREKQVVGILSLGDLARSRECSSFAKEALTKISAYPRTTQEKRSSA